MNKYKVYLHTVPSLITGYEYDKYYVGITNKKNVQERWGYKGNGYKTQIFYRAIKKYGWENIKHDVLVKDLDEDCAKSVEIALISALQSDIDHHGYNMTMGGDGVKDAMKSKCRNVYCFELNALFKNTKVASIVTKDSESGIRGRCKSVDNGIFPENKKLKYHYCYIEQMYKFYDKARMSYSSKPIVRLSDRQLFGSSAIAEKILNIHHIDTRSILNYASYLKRKNNYSLYKKDYFMYAKDYLMIEDLTKIV